tara:strand:+ start:432 stop:866 length:435 start_codon:yes stop_codon:yes gene_type:complete
MIKELRHVGLVVTDIEKALDFWQNMLGFELVKRMEESGQHVDQMIGLQGVRVTTAKLKDQSLGMVELLQFHSHPDKSQWDGTPFSTGLTHIAFTVTDIEKTYEEFKLAGVEFPAPPQLSPDGSVKVIYAKGPEGLLMELVEVLA